jgi:prephenate dehydratase
MRIAIQGTSGAFHEFAAKKWFNDTSIDFIYCDTFRDVFRTLQNNEADHAVVAIENSLYGSINEVYDLLQKHHFTIRGEVMLHIHQQLIGLPGASLEALERVYSQDVALAQCEEFLAHRTPQATPTEHHDTAASVEYIKAQKNPRYGAIASRFSAQHFGLPILAENIEDNPQNYTRFVVLQEETAPIENADKTSLIVVTDHTSGALYRMLGVFAQHAINLATMHSRPIPEKPWRHKFYLDLDAAGTTLHTALADLEAQNISVTILGEYKQSIITYDT